MPLFLIKDSLMTTNSLKKKKIYITERCDSNFFFGFCPRQFSSEQTWLWITAGSVLCPAAETIQWCNTVCLLHGHAQRFCRMFRFSTHTMWLRIVRENIVTTNIFQYVTSPCIFSSILISSFPAHVCYTWLNNKNRISG